MHRKLHTFRGHCVVISALDKPARVCVHRCRKLMTFEENNLSSGLEPKLGSSLSRQRRKPLIRIGSFPHGIYRTRCVFNGFANVARSSRRYLDSTARAMYSIYSSKWKRVSSGDARGRAPRVSMKSAKFVSGNSFDTNLWSSSLIYRR